MVYDEECLARNMLDVKCLYMLPIDSSTTCDDRACMHYVTQRRKSLLIVLEYIKKQINVLMYLSIRNIKISRT